MNMTRHLFLLAAAIRDPRQAKFTGDLAFGQMVTVPVRDVDRYKRTVAEIILPDGRNLNQELVRAGLAWWYTQYAKRDTVLRDLEQEARDAKRGLWSDSQAVTPWEWRKGSGGASGVALKHGIVWAFSVDKLSLPRT